MSVPNIISIPAYSPSNLAGKILLNPGLAKYLPDPLQGFPSCVQSDLCWNQSDFPHSCGKYIIMLSDEDVEAIEKAIAAFKELHLPLSYLDPSTFLLPFELANRLRCVSKVVHDGIGFAVLRGLNPNKYSAEENAIAFCGITSHIGTQRSTNSAGMAMNHIRNASGDVKPEGTAADKELAPSKRQDGMKFHADRMYADVLSLYIKGQASTGGEQYIASFPTIYNKLRQQAPEVLRVLAGDWQWSPPDKVEEGTPSSMPAMFHADGRVMLQLVWQPFLNNPGLATPAQRRALEAVQRLAEDSCIKIDQQPGDIQLINNLAILHTRSAFVDSPSHKRHLLRVGLRDPAEAWTLPRRYEALFGKAFATPVEDQKIPVTDFDAWGETATEDLNHG